MRKTCIIIQGQLYSPIVDDLVKTHSIYPHKILSTWNTEDQECVKLCKENGFIVIQQDPPEYKCSVNYQVKSLQAGFIKAKELGFTHGFRIRTDVKLNNISKLIENLDVLCPEGSLGFVTMYQNEIDSQEYLTDHFAYGSLDTLLNYFGNYQSPYDNRFPELFLMENFFKIENITYENIKNRVFLFHELLLTLNINVFFTKPEHIYQGEMTRRWLINNNHPKTLELREKYI